MFIYQIGDVIIRGFAEHNSPVSWRGNVSYGEQSSQISFSNFYRIPEPVSITLNGTLKCFNDLSPIEQQDRLMAIGGQPNIDIIGYLPNFCCRPGTVCSICGSNEDQNSGVHWWHTYGMIRSINRNFILDRDHEEQFTTLDVTIELVVNPYWMPLNRFNWFPYYSSDNPDHFNLISDDVNPPDDETEDDEQIIGFAGGAEIYFHPDRVVAWHYNPEFVWLKKSFVNPYQLYIPTYWDDYVDDIYGYGTSLSGVLTSYAVETTWSGEIKTLHCFGNLPTSGVLEIETQVQIAPFRIQTFNSTIDLADLHALLSLTEFGSTGLTSDYLLYAGTDDISPSFLFKVSTEQPVANLTPTWTYENRCPGEIFGRKTIVTITKPDPSITVGALHLMRKL